MNRPLGWHLIDNDNSDTTLPRMPSLAALLALHWPSRQPLDDAVVQQLRASGSLPPDVRCGGQPDTL
jgi:hypothetical protein